ncbi:MAG: MFS transporter [Tyzzerella sp.]|nr:MFS transporter [Tyzzerella sp.]
MHREEYNGKRMTDMTMDNSSALKRSRIMYMCEATLEYLISILVAGSYLATLTRELGISDSLTGILSSVISLGCLFQLLSMFYRKQKVKRFVILMSIVNQLMFMLLYVIPLGKAASELKIAVFVIMIIAAYVIYNFAHPKKIDWMMSLVDDSYRGRFTANKEIISLICGMIFSFVMGSVVDYFSEKNEIRTAFILSAVVIFILMVSHTLSMVLTIEKPEVEEQKEKSLKKSISELLSNKDVIRVSAMFVLFNISRYAAIPFFGTYEIKELGFNLKMVSVFTMTSSIVRIFVSRFWGTYADKNSFAKMIEKCLLIWGIGFVCVAFATPSWSRYLIIGYHICQGISLGGINSALINMIFDYVTPDKRADSLAICQAGAGLVGFLSTIVMSPIVAMIQENGNTLFGISIYAQQVVSIIGLIFALITVLFVRRNFMKIKTN